MMKKLLYAFLFLAVSSFAGSLEHIIVNGNLSDLSHQSCSDMGSTYGASSYVFDYNTTSFATAQCENVFNFEHISIPDGMVGIRAYKINEYPITRKNPLDSNTCDFDFTSQSRYHCDYEVSCTDEPAPNDIPYPHADFGGGCKDYNDLTVSEKEIYPTQGGLVCDACFVAPYDVHNCTAPKTLDISVYPNRCYYDPLGDADGDGIPNDEDLDANGNGVIDSNKVNPDNPCQGANILGNYSYPFNQYSYYGVATESQCSALLNGSVDNVILLDDIQAGCTEKYCYFHSKDFKCNSFNAVDYKPSSEYVYKSGYGQSGCDALNDGVRYSDSQFIFPDLTNCEYTAFCYAKPIVNQPDINNSLGTNESDINSTSNPDLQPLLNSQNDTNKHLKNLNDKVDKTNDNLDDLKNTNSDILTNNKDMKKDLDKLSLNSNKSLTNQLSTINSLDKIKNSSDSLNTNMNNMRKTLVTSTATIQGSLQQLNTKQDTANQSFLDGLFSDVNPFDDANLTDGSETFGALQGQVTDNLNITYHTGLFNLSSLAPQIPTVTFNLLGTTFTMLSPDMFSSLPIADIRALIMLIFALMGFITVIRTI